MKDIYFNRESDFLKQFLRVLHGKNNAAPFRRRQLLTPVLTYY